MACCAQQSREVLTIVGSVILGGVFIPFLKNDITKYVDPVKFYEYRLAGKAILSTPFGEMLWHHKEEAYNSDTTLGITIPDNTLVFPSPKKPNDIPRWSGRFSHVFTGY